MVSVQDLFCPRSGQTCLNAWMFPRFGHARLIFLGLLHVCALLFLFDVDPVSSTHHSHVSICAFCNAPE